MRQANDIYIKSSQVKLLDRNRQLIGIFSAKRAKDYANEKDLDLIEINGSSNPAIYMLGIKDQATVSDSGKPAPKTAQVRLMDAERKPLGVISAQDAMDRAAAEGLDLIPLNEKCDPAVYMLGDYKKYMYDQNKAKKELDKKNRAAAKASEEKEIQLPSDTTDSSKNDRDRLMGRGNEFLGEGHPVKFTVRFSGRRITHADDVVDRIVNELRESITNGTIMKVTRSDRQFIINAMPKKK